ncbi:hypothetical protein [Flavivirga eckloniae]|uniref:Uncharacterized protein n=1 Tax=Flavivirga eckloniae TaxID=1803846 RepID=A0A2K9PV63_9FLAO|nr:hypothetical protein [Flavivirga eckloniae]AUP80962.1 hypothetical protein C1H87_20505 [Flavivirga eckloniae]
MNNLNNKGKKPGTKRVFSKNNMVFIRKEVTNSSGSNDDEWYPVNFQWIPVISLRENLRLTNENIRE